MTQILPIESRVDSSQNQFLEAFGDQPAGFLYDFRQGPASDLASGIRNDTIGTKSIASLLDFDVGAGSGFHGSDQT